MLDENSYHSILCWRLKIAVEVFGGVIQSLGLAAKGQKMTLAQPTLAAA
jgi:hypothetical protein